MSDFPSLTPWAYHSDGDELSVKFYHVLVHLAIQKLCHATQPPRSSECRDTADILWVLQAPEQCQILSLSHLSPRKYGRDIYIYTHNIYIHIIIKYIYILYNYI